MPDVDWISAHSSALVAVPCTSGPTGELSTGDAGWQLFRPGVVGPVTVGEDESVGEGEGAVFVFCATGEGDNDPCEPLEQAVNSTSKKAR